MLCSPIRETGALFTEKTIIPFATWVHADTAKKVASWRLARLAGPYIRRFLHGSRLKKYQPPNNGTQYQGVPYTLEEVERSILCFKGVDSAIDVNGLLKSPYEEVSHVGLVRDGYAVCSDCWMRRRLSAPEAGRKDTSLVRKILAQKHPSNRSILVRFEDILRDPFRIAGILFRALKLDPVEIPKIRLKAKRFLTPEGGHEARFGEEGSKYWFGPDEIARVIDVRVDERQRAALKPATRRSVEKAACSVLEELGYPDRS